MIMVALAIIPMLVVGVGGMLIANRSISDLTLKQMDNHARDILRRSEDRITFLEQSLTEFSANILTVDAVLDSGKDFKIQNPFTNYLFSFLLSKQEITRLLIIREDQTVFGYNYINLARDAKPGVLLRDEILTEEACDFLDQFTEEFACPNFSFYRSLHTTESTSLLLCHRIRDPSTLKPIAVVVAHIDFLESPSLFDNITLWPEEEIFLLRGDGAVLAATKKSRIGKVQNPIATGAFPAHQQYPIDGVMTSYSAIQGRYDIEIQVRVPLSVLQETASQQLLVIGSILVLTAGVLLVFILLIKKRFFGKLGDFSQILRSREASPLQPIEGEWGDDEISELVKNFNLVAGQAKKEFIHERERLEHLKRLELAALQSQIKPHFLYNTLDVGVWYAKEANADKLQTLLIKLSRYYRLSLSSGENLISIRNELHHAMLYMEMEQLRMSHSFKIMVDIPENIQNYYIDKITLQPIVENCIKHGIKTKAKGTGYIAISAEIIGENIELVVDDNGVGMDESSLSSVLQRSGESGYAVSNVHRRLVLRYGEMYGLRFQSEVGVGTSVRILLPKVADSEGTIIKD